MSVSGEYVRVRQEGRLERETGVRLCRFSWQRYLARISSVDHGEALKDFKQESDNSLIQAAVRRQLPIVIKS